MSDIDDLVKKVAKIAEEEGVGRRDGPDRMFPDPGDSRNFQRVVERVKSEVLAGRLEGRGADGTKGPSTTPEVALVPASDSAVSDQRKAVSRGNESEDDQFPTPRDIVDEQIAFLGKWVEALRREAKRDFVKYWIFKIPALTASVSSSALEAFGYGPVVIVLGVAGAFCIGLDAAFPRGLLHNVHKRAAAEARRLQADVLLEWRKLELLRSDDQGAREHVLRIIERIQVERTRIDQYVTAAEANLGGGPESPK